MAKTKQTTDTTAKARLRDKDGLVAKDRLYRALVDSIAKGQPLTAVQLQALEPKLSLNTCRKWKSLWSRDEPLKIPLASREYKPASKAKKAPTRLSVRSPASKRPAAKKAPAKAGKPAKAKAKRTPAKAKA